MPILRKLGFTLAVPLAALLSGCVFILINLDGAGWSHAAPQFMYMWRPSLE